MATSANTSVSGKLARSGLQTLAARASCAAPELGASRARRVALSDALAGSLLRSQDRAGRSPSEEVPALRSLCISNLRVRRTIKPEEDRWLQEQSSGSATTR